MVTQDDDRRTLRQIPGTPSIVDWAEQNVGDTHIGKRKLKARPRKDKGKKAKTTEERVLGSDESTPSSDEGGSPPYQESNLSNSASSDDDDGGGYHHSLLFSSQVRSTNNFTCILSILLSFHLKLVQFFSQVSHNILMPLKIRTMVHHNLRGRPLRTRTYIQAGEGEDNIIFPQRIAHLLKIQVTLRPMPMDSTHTWPPIPHNWSKTCNGSISMRIKSSITCWWNNGKQLSHGRGKYGKSTRPNCWLHRGWHSCLPLSTI
jgi:hypothetical protein